MTAVDGAAGAGVVGAEDAAANRPSIEPDVEPDAPGEDLAPSLVR